MRQLRSGSGGILTRMPDKPGESAAPTGDEIQQAIRDYIAAAAAEGARAAARRLMDAVQVPLDEVLGTLAQLGPKDVAARGPVGLASMGVAGNGVVVYGETARAVASASAGAVIVTVSPQEVSTAINEISTIGETQVNKLSGRLPLKWSRRETIFVAVLFIFDVYLLLPSGTREYLLEFGNLIQAVAAIIELLGKR